MLIKFLCAHTTASRHAFVTVRMQKGSTPNGVLPASYWLLVGLEGPLLWGLNYMAKTLKPPSTTATVPVTNLAASLMR